MAGSISFPGIGSGIDGASIADSLFDQLTLQNAPRQSKISALQSENNALDTLGELIIGVADALSPFQTLNGGGGAKIASSSNSDVVSASAGSDASTGSFTVNVFSLASNASGSFNASFASGDDAVFSSDVGSQKLGFTVGTGDDAQSFAIEVDSATTVDGLVNAINEASGGALVASTVNIGTEDDPDVRITFQTSETGVEDGSLTISADDALEEVLGGTTITQATNAVFEVSSISGTIERGSNNVDDVISGVSLQLNQVGAATISVSDDASASASQLQSFVAAFNSLVEFVNSEDAVAVSQQNGESVNIAGALANTNIDDAALREIRNTLLSVTSDDGSISLAGLGVSTNRDGTLSFDEEAFEQAFNANPGAAQDAVTNFADALGGATGSLQEFTAFGKLIDSAQDANNEEISNVEQTISNVERSARSRQEALLGQFTSLESLLAKLNSDAGLITSLLQL